MQLQYEPPLHLTYCLNVHPAETWPETFEVIRTHPSAVRKALATRVDLPGGPFGLGLRISDLASRQLLDTDGGMEQLHDLLGVESLYVFTINGFPFGQFHNTGVKSDVYAPDWRSDQRRAYTCRLADILARLLPEGASGSISTVPVSYDPWMTGDADRAAAGEQLARTAEYFRRLAGETGRRILLALEPEPDCTVGTTSQAITFFGDSLLRNASDEATVRRHIGLCVDTAHCAVEFERPAEAIAKLQQAGIAVAKVQLSAALEADAGDQAFRALADFDERVYLHQVRVRAPGGALLRFEDLGPALACDAARRDGATWRVHFHVPLFWAGGDVLRSTRPLLDADLAEQLAGGACPHAEIETYTFGVLPASLWSGRVDDGIAGEFEWTLKWLAAHLSSSGATDAEKRG
ncbi:MAG: metabolite traffic protein EboE [Planctomycetes bacterium]|jgi:sugar phosphate isomerase/epimerase|nr:metabolite traffic protein EboE [Planctomycetota bacterium]